MRRRIFLGAGLREPSGSRKSRFAASVRFSIDAMRGEVVRTLRIAQT
jgi:hypothetical protein